MINGKKKKKSLESAKEKKMVVDVWGKDKCGSDIMSSVVLYEKLSTH